MQTAVYQKLDPIRATFQLSRLLSDHDGDAQTQANRALKQIALCTGADRVFLCVWEPAKQTICTVAQWQIELLDPMPSQAVKVDSFSLLDEYFAQNRGLFHMHKEVVFFNHRLIGALCLESRDSINRLSQNEQSFIQSAAHLLAPVLQVFEHSACDANVDIKEFSKLSASDAHQSASESDSSAPVVLIVEDNKINQLTILKMLERCGVVVHAADDGLQCISACHKRKYDLILMDLSMPHMDGFDTTREIITSCPFNRQTPIVAVSAHTDQAMQARCLKVGMLEFIAKPLRTQRIRELVDQYLGRSGSDDQTS